jgi:hypothetical protein
MVVSGQFHFELLLSLGNKNPFSILQGRVEYDTECLKVKKELLSDHAKSFMVKSPESVCSIKENVSA